ncbi:DNA-binding transcriptional LysR family regulator [Antricoccus suffuscus]|uniref:DNA-binding transcriptional LysR family regulator n=1 Tax=Antricoccus suffuscus TaxID=1629062 RepID=A0A2T1A7J3_9ACTN|nr:LysR family transcriptional regulator [Antricoccus suffuscus]PRZ44308.1 DNA-binding transcriptional LysR family regulator [Antricoccus suffuscus]
MGWRDVVDSWMTGSVDVRRLEYFLAVVDYGGVVKAAAAIPVAQPSLSRSIKTLEHELGVALFDRSGRRLELTDVGRALVAPARQMLADTAAARAAVDEVSRLSGGRLDIVALPTLAMGPLAELTGEFRRRYPRVGVQILAPKDSTDLLEMVRTGVCEVGLTVLPIGAGGLVQHNLPSQVFDLVEPPDGKAPPRPGDRPVARADLVDIDWVATPTGRSSRRLLERALESVDGIPNIVVETDAAEAVVPLVLAGAGAALLPRRMALHAAEQGARVRAIVPPVSRDIAVVCRPGALSPPAAAFVEIVRTL